MNERYQGVREEPSSLRHNTVLARTADKLVLTDSNGENRIIARRAMRGDARQRRQSGGFAA